MSGQPQATQPEARRSAGISRAVEPGRRRLRADHPKIPGSFSRSGLAMLRYGGETRVIDVACGPGTTRCSSHRRCDSITCVDFSAAMLDQLRRNMAAAKATNVEIVEADGQALPFRRQQLRPRHLDVRPDVLPGPPQGICRAFPRSRARWAGAGVELGAGRAVAVDARRLCSASA